MRYMVDFIQMGIVIWGLSLRDVINNIPVDGNKALDDEDIQKQ